MITLTHLFIQVFNHKYIFRWHYLLLFIVLFGVAVQAKSSNTLLILGDSLSAGYKLPLERSWASLLATQWQQKSPAIQVINASISGNTAAEGLTRLPALLQQHQPKWVLIELGANDGLRGFAPPAIERDLATIISLIQQAKASPLLMQIKIPPNYGQRYSQSFSAIFPRLALQYRVPLVPFYMEQVALKPEWMQADGLHPNIDAQPFIADWLADQIQPLLIE